MTEGKTKNVMDVLVDVRKEERIIDNFWNCVHFHPTDAIEDEWGQTIIRTMAKDGAASFMRIYAMLEDIVSENESGSLQYDFSQNDARMDFLVSHGFDLLVCINFMPDCIASEPGRNMGIPRYKGKRVNNSVPSDYRKWEEVCYQYAYHLVERYGKERLKNWRFHCWNEPDHEYWVTSKTCFDYQNDGDKDKITEYIKLYDYFEQGFRRACPDLKVGGPSAAFCDNFIHEFLQHISEGCSTVSGEKGTRLDFLTVHAYADLPYEGTGGTVSPYNILKRVQIADEMLADAGLSDVEIVVDEWGAAAGGFLSIKKNPMMVLRENEFYPAFYFRLINSFTYSTVLPEKMLICLSGQHKSSYDFDGYRSMFTMSGFRKPIYNGFVLASKLGKIRLVCDEAECIPTVNEKGDVVIALYHGGESPLAEPEPKKISLQIRGLQGSYLVRKSVIDRCHSNSYRYWQSIGAPKEINLELQKKIKEAGYIVPTEKTEEIQKVYREEVMMEGHSVVLLELIRQERQESSALNL